MAAITSKAYAEIGSLGPFCMAFDLAAMVRLHLKLGSFSSAPRGCEMSVYTHISYGRAGIYLSDKGTDLILCVQAVIRDTCICPRM